MARVTEQEHQYCPKLSLAQVAEHFGEHAQGMLNHYRDEWTDCLIARDAIKNNMDLTEDQKTIALVFLKHINQENRIVRAIKHCERVVAMRGKVYYDRLCPPGKMYYMNLPIEEAKTVPIETLAPLEGVKRVGDKIKAYCPLGHKNKSYTLIINANNTFICHNCKDEGGKGSAIDFVMKRDGVDIMTAVRVLMGIKRETERT